MGIFDFFGKKPVATDSEYVLECNFHPFRLSARRNDAVDLEITLKNNSDTVLLTSLVVVVPKQLGLDKTGLMLQREFRLGELNPGETKYFTVPIHSTPKSEPNNYPVKVFAISNYRDYGHVLNQVRKDLSLRVE
ncbi:hypothetical protein HUU53_00250 [Candidatus Micrarchaeota archaeon]|nr:hypothetical protein [Candidatus Micrarchaeota archaeon]